MPTGVTMTCDFWGMQLEAGSNATAFQTATGNIQGELAACQRYYWRQTGGNGNYAGYGTGGTNGSSQPEAIVRLPVSMRINPTVLDYSTLAFSDGSTVQAYTNLVINYSTQTSVTIGSSTAFVAAYRPVTLLHNNNSTTAFFAVSAEL
jgi:hypothetical protein